MTSQEQINELFTKYGTIKNFKWISKEGSKMALIELNSLEESVLALIVIFKKFIFSKFLNLILFIKIIGLTQLSTKRLLFKSELC